MRKNLILVVAILGAVLAAGLAVSQPNTLNYGEHGGARTVIGGSLDVVSGGDLDVESGGALKIAGTTVTSTAAELNVLDGVTATAAQINAVDGGMAIDHVILCGQADENGTIYLGPATGAWQGDGSDASIGSTACDALDSATEATADAALVIDTAYKILGGLCSTAANLGAGESIVFTMRTAEGDTVPTQTCTVGVGEFDCSITTATTTDVAAGATIAMKAVETSNNADDDLWCRMTIAYQ